RCSCRVNPGRIQLCRADPLGPADPPGGQVERTTAKRIHESKPEDIPMSGSLTPDAVIVATKQQVSCDLGDEAAILGMKNSVYYGLNPVGARIWRLLQQPKSVGEIRDAIASEYDVSAKQAEDDIVKLVEQLMSEGLVEFAGESR
ncbi:MAG: PqqD family protein, partial [Candidatus Acidiferrales bacterium]